MSRLGGGPPKRPFLPGNTIGFKKGFDPNRNITKPGPGLPKMSARLKAEQKFDELLDVIGTWLTEGKIKHESYMDFIGRYGGSTKAEAEHSGKDGGPIVLTVTYEEGDE